MRGTNLRANKKLMGLIIILLLLIVWLYTCDPITQIDAGGLVIKLDPIEPMKIKKWLETRKNMSSLSKLGKVLFQTMPEPKDTGSYKILIWKYGSTIENRHLKHFSKEKVDPFKYCPVSNCVITYKDEDLTDADIVIFHLHRTKGLTDIPKRLNTKQIWAFLTDESPYHTFLSSKNPLKDFNGLFNWSMTYRSDSDIPVPYGRTVLRNYPEIDIELNLQKRRDILVAIMGSNCHANNHRWSYVKELQKFITVDIYGGCGPMKNACPGHFGADCPLIGDYLFYLSFENSNCNEYITEKLWWNAYHKNSIPIVMGSNISSYEMLLPIDSYINVDEFANPKDLAEFLLQLNKTEEFKRYYNWKTNFEVLNEHGYFQSKSYHYCRICQALNYNTKETKVYTDLEKYWSVKQDCHSAWDEWRD